MKSAVEGKINPEFMSCICCCVHSQFTLNTLQTVTLLWCYLLSPTWKESTQMADLRYRYPARPSKCGFHLQMHSSFGVAWICRGAGRKLCVFYDTVAEKYSDRPLVPLEHAPTLYHLCQAYRTDLTWCHGEWLTAMWINIMVGILLETSA